VVIDTHSIGRHSCGNTLAEHKACYQPIITPGRLSCLRKTQRKVRRKRQPRL
jgi:hypothetical protein